MAKVRCLIPSSEFVYAVINDNVTVEQNKELPLMKWGGGSAASAEGTSTGRRDPIFNCADGNLSGLNIYDGTFTAPRDGLYNITFLCKYKVSTFSADSALVGNTNTKIATFKASPDRLVNPIGSTNPFSKFKGKYVSACSISAVLPLVKGEVMVISLYQNSNISGRMATIDAELVIMYDSSFDVAIGTGELYEDVVRCPGFEGPQGVLELFVPDRKYYRYAQAPQNRFKPFDEIEIMDILGKTSRFFPSYFEEIDVRYSEEWHIKTNNKKMLNQVDILGVVYPKKGNARPRPFFGYDTFKIIYKDGELEEEQAPADLTTSQITETVNKERAALLEAIKDEEEEIVENLSNKGIIRYVDTDRGKTPLKIAIEAKNMNLVRRFAVGGAVIDGELLDLAEGTDEEIYNYLLERIGYLGRFGRGARRVYRIGTEYGEEYGGL